MSNDPLMVKIQGAIAILHGGDRDGARQCFDRIWVEMQPDPTPLHECILAHYMADAQDGAREELQWDLRALAAAERSSDADAKAVHETLSISGFMPSLYLNLADVYLRLGDPVSSRRYQQAGTASAGMLPDTPYGAMIKNGLDRLAKRLSEGI
jgi:hypothetical protein